MSDVPSLSPQPEEEPDNLSLKNILDTFHRHWISITLCAVLGSVAGLCAAALRGYSYEKTARVILRDGKQKNTTATDLVLSEFGLGAGGVNLANESYVVKSTDLMCRVVEKLKLNISYWKKQNIRTLDLYTATPLTVDFPEIEEKTRCEFAITPLDNTRYSIRARLESEPPSPDFFSEGTFGIPLSLPFATIVVRPTSFFSPEAHGTTITVRRASIRKTADNFLNLLTVTRPDAKESSLIEMQIRGSHPEKAEDILNELIAEYKAQSIVEKKAAANKAENFLIWRLKKLGTELDEVDRKILDFRTKNKLVIDPTISIGANYTNLLDTGREEFNINTQLKQLSMLIAMLSSQQKKHIMLPVNLGIEDQGIARQIEHYNTTYLRYSQLKESAGVKNPVVTTLVDNMDAMKDTLSISVINYRDSLKLRLKDLKEKQVELSTGLASTASQETILIPMLRSRKVKEELYIMLLGKKEENALAIATTESSARVLEYAFGENKPVSPKTSLFVIAGGGAGFTLCLFTFMFVSSLNTKLKTKQDIKNASLLPILAELPTLSRQERIDGWSLRTGDHSIMSECFHILRSNVESLVPEKTDSALTVMVTSSITGEGKTFISANLAHAFGLIGKKVLLVDGDLRKGSLTKNQKRTHEAGFSTLLHSTVITPELLTRAIVSLEEGSGVDFLGTGPLPPNPIPLLSRERLQELLDLWKSRYDCIVIDSPPFGLLADSSILARQADSALYVIRSGKIDKSILSSIQQLADNGKLPNTSLVLNAVNFKTSRYHYYSRDYYYGK